MQRISKYWIFILVASLEHSEIFVYYILYFIYFNFVFQVIAVSFHKLPPALHSFSTSATDSPCYVIVL